MTKQDFYSNIFEQMAELRNDFKDQISGMNDSTVDKVLESVMVSYNYAEKKMIVEFTSGSYGVFLFYSNVTDRNCIWLPVSVLFEDDEKELEKIVSHAVNDSIDYYNGELEYLTNYGEYTFDSFDDKEKEDFTAITSTLNFLKSVL